MKSRQLISILFIFLVLFSVLSPLQIYAAGYTFGGIVPCGNEIDSNGNKIDPNQVATSCNLTQFIQLIQNIIIALFALSVPIATVALVYVGWLLLTAQGDIGKRQEAKRIALSVITGFIIILCAWLVVYTITHALLNPSFNEFLQ